MDQSVTEDTNTEVPIVTQSLPGLVCSQCKDLTYI